MQLHTIADMESKVPNQQLQEDYGTIMELYDFADDLADTVDSELVADKDQQLAIVGDLIEQLGESADILTEEFIKVAEGKSRPKTAKNRVEKALRKAYMAVDAYYRRVGYGVKGTLRAVRNIADPIVDRVKKQLEQIIVIFLNIVDLSLERIMHKFEIEEIKRRYDRVSFLLHQMSQQQH